MADSGHSHDSSPAASADPTGLRDTLRRSERERLIRMARIVAAAYVPVAASHLLMLPRPAQAPMIAVALACALLLYLGAGRLAVATDYDWSQAWGTSLLYTCIVAHSLVRLLYARESHDTMFVGVLAVAMALLPGTMLLHTLAVSSYLAGWAVIMIVGDGYAHFTPYLGPLLLTFGVSLTVHFLEHSRRQRLYELQLLNDRRRTRLLESEAERRHALKSLAHEARHDSLTGMPNRAAFVERLERAFQEAREGELELAVLYLDLDRFKLINDSLGHEVGDRLLRAVSERLLRFVRPGDAVARFSGDEFAVLLVNLRASSDALTVAERLHTVFEEPFRLGEHDVPLSASIGIAPYQPDYADPADMLRDADIAMHEAKGTDDSLRVVDSEMHARAVTRLQTELDLRRALRDGQLEVHYQPLVRVADESVAGFEALVRWRHPERGFLSPADFLPLAVETGLIVAVDRFVMGRACRDLKAWCDQDPSLEAFVSTNVSARHFAQADFEEEVQRHLAESGLDPRQLWVEVIEGAVIDQADLAEQRIASLRAMGVTVAVDDFGVGYSSLGYLQRFPFNVMKLDRSFMERSKRNEHLLDALVRVARGLDMRVVAEGIEERHQLEQVRHLSVDLGQGYLFARPMPAEEVVAFFGARPRPSTQTH